MIPKNGSGAATVLTGEAPEELHELGGSGSLPTNTQAQNQELIGSNSLPDLAAPNTRIHELADEQTQADRRWFEKHPGRKHYVRPAHPAEIAEFEIVSTVPPGYQIYVAVRNVRPGVRLRATFCRGAGFPVWELSEKHARRIFRDLADDRVKEVEAALRGLR